MEDSVLTTSTVGDFGESANQTQPLEASRQNSRQETREEEEEEKGEGETRAKNDSLQQTKAKHMNGGQSKDPFPGTPVGVYGGGITRAAASNDAIHFDVERHILTHNHPGFYPDVDKYGHPHVNGLLFQIVPNLMYYIKNPCETPEGTFWLFDINDMIKTKTCSMIALNFYMEMDLALYNHSVSLAKLTGNIRLFKGASKSNKQFYLEQLVWTPDRRHRLLRIMSTPALFDQTVRSMLAVPDHVVSSLPSVQADLIPKIWQEEQPPPPSHAYRYSVSVVWCHVDCNGHMGFQWYAQHAVDAVVLAMTSQDTEAMKTLTVSNLAVGVRNMNILYLKECHYGDRLDVLAWQDESKENTANCRIERRGEVVSKSVITFYSPEDQARHVRDMDQKASSKSLL